MIWSKIRMWLHSLNGWRRLWLVASVLAIGYGVIVYPISTNGNYKLIEIRIAMENSDCAGYINDEFIKLKEVGLDAPCYEIYEYRKKLPGHSEFNYEEYERDFSKSRRERMISDAIFGGIFFSILSIISYIAGRVLVWILMGFREDR